MYNDLELIDFSSSISYALSGGIIYCELENNIKIIDSIF